MLRTGTTVRVLIVEDDPDQSLLLGRWLKAIPDLAVTFAADGEEAFARLLHTEFDILISDVQLPGVDGLTVVSDAKHVQRGIRVVVMTASADLQHTLQAIRSKVDAFLLKPISRVQFVDEVQGLVDRVRLKSKKRRRVLAIGAHPDDVEIGCGGILLGHARAGASVRVLTLTGGEAGGSTNERAAEARRAANLIGADLSMSALPDTRVSDGIETIKEIGSVIAEFAPDVIYTHSSHDLHQDHRAVHQATLVAARRVPNVFCYQSPSGTTSFTPSQFLDVEAFIDDKIRVIAAYGSQTAKCAYLDPELIRATARYWARYANARYVEPLEVIRTTTSVVADEHMASLPAPEYRAS